MPPRLISWCKTKEPPPHLLMAFRNLWTALKPAAVNYIVFKRFLLNCCSWLVIFRLWPLFEELTGSWRTDSSRVWKIWAMNGQQLANRSRLTKNFVPASLRTRTSLVSGFKSSDSVRYCTQPLEQRTLILNHKVFFICIKIKLNYWFFFIWKFETFLSLLCATENYGYLG